VSSAKAAASIVPASGLPHPDVGAAWRDARGPASVIHLDHAACSRQSRASQEAVSAHCRRESEIGGYEAEAEVGPLLDRGRAALGELVGFAGRDVAFMTSAHGALVTLLDAWRAEPGDEVACIPGEFGPSLTAFAQSRLRIRELPMDPIGRVDLDRLRAHLVAHRPTLVHLTHVPSHRGIVQPADAVASVCRSLDLPLVVDAAQAAAHVAPATQADAVYGTSRKWLCGPRGVGFLAVRPQLVAQLHIPLDEGVAADSAPDPVARLEPPEAHVAGRIGLCVAVDELVAAGPDRARDRLAALGSAVRTGLDGVNGWRVVEPHDEPTAMTTLLSPPGVDIVEARARLHQHGVLVALVNPTRAPREMTEPVLRISPHVGTTTEDIRTLIDILERH
jgi:hercynylcysteine S-oxide lyase